MYIKIKWILSTILSQQTSQLYSWMRIGMGQLLPFTQIEIFLCF